MADHPDPPPAPQRVLNVGGGSKAIPIPDIYAGWDHVLLDIDPAGQPDIVCDARQLHTQTPAAFDSVYCSHNLEHYYRHDVPHVLAGFLHVLKPHGFAYVRVPDIAGVIRAAARMDLDVDDVLYQCPAGPVRVSDVLYGYAPEIERSRQDFFAHKTGFSRRTLALALHAAGFGWVYSGGDELEARAFAFASEPTPAAKCLLRL